jgi:hypothetical protein
LVFNSLHFARVSPSLRASPRTALVIAGFGPHEAALLVGPVTKHGLAAGRFEINEMQWSFQKIDVQFQAGKISGMDDWDARD